MCFFGGEEFFFLLLMKTFVSGPANVGLTGDLFYFQVLRLISANAGYEKTKYSSLLISVFELPVR